MRSSRVSLVIVASFLLASVLGGAANAQYLISSKAGFVNRVEGQVYILRGDGADGEKMRASLGSQMRVGDRLSVQNRGFAETLLNPGSYLRLSENTEVRAVSVNLDEVRFELIKGSVIVEIGQIDKKTPIEIITPQRALTIAKSGLYRIDIKDKATMVSVRQGEIHLGTRADFAANRSFKIKRGKVVTLTGADLPTRSDIAKLDKDAIDKFDTWSFSRAQALTAANVRALSRSGSLTSGWYYDPSFNFYTFVPTRSWFSSPYGFGFFNNYRECNYYNPYYVANYNNGNYGNGGGSSAAPPAPRVPPRVVSGCDRGEVTRVTDRRIRMGDSGFGSGSGGYQGPGRSGGGASSPGGGSSGGGFGGGRGGGGASSGGGGGSPSPSMPRISAPSIERPRIQ